jgi:ER degradation enhancer, mannosidase alpha-like 2
MNIRLRIISRLDGKQVTRKSMSRLVALFVLMSVSGWRAQSQSFKTVGNHFALNERLTRTYSESDSVRKEFLHAWNGYKQYAWGHDALKPLSKQPKDWYRVSLLMTPVDAFDTMVLMGLKKEAAEAKQLIFDSLSFNLDMEIQTFEITIRMLGGLLSAYQLDGDKRFLELAEDLGTRLLPEFNSATGMPYRFVNLKTGAIRDSLNNPAEIGTSLIEFGTLSKLTGNPVYYEKSKNALVQLFNRRSTIGLVGSVINVETGEWVDKTSHIGGGIDSYYEYLLKCAILFKDEDCLRMWNVSIKAVNRYVADTTTGELWYGQVDMNTGVRSGTMFGALEAFFPAVLCLNKDIATAKRLERSCYQMWNVHSIEPESMNYTTMKADDKHYVLRPEIIESAYYLSQYTKAPSYKVMGTVFFKDLVHRCRTEIAFAALKDVTTGEKMDQMESFVFAETMKYLYLLLSPESPLDFDNIVFNTEAHPIRPTWNKP